LINNQSVNSDNQRLKLKRKPGEGPANLERKKVMKNICIKFICLFLLFCCLVPASRPARATGGWEQAVTQAVYGDVTAVSQSVYREQSAVLPELPQTPEAYAAGSYAQLAARLVVTGDVGGAVMQDGTVEVWGNSNTFGQQDVPPGLQDVKALAGDGSSFLALTEEGRLVTWGKNDRGQCNIPSILENQEVRAIATRSGTSAAITGDGKLVVWGRSISTGTWNLPDLGGKKAVAVRCTVANLFALCADGTVLVWDYTGTKPVAVPAGFSGNVVAIAPGNNLIALALKADGTVVSWNSDPAVYDPPPGLSDVRAIAAGDYNGVALTGDGTVTVWGNSERGLLHDDPDAASGLTGVQAVAFAYSSLYAVRTDGGLIFRGSQSAPAGLNLYSQVSVNNKLSGLSVVNVVYESGKEKEINCGIYPSFSSIMTEGVADVCYGAGEQVLISARPYSSRATLRINGLPAAPGVAASVYGLAEGDNIIPVEVTAENGASRVYTLHIKKIAADYVLPQTPAAYRDSLTAQYARKLAYQLAVKKNGTVVAWSANNNFNVPMYLDGVVAVASVGQSSYTVGHGLALRQDGTVAAWGTNTKGQCDVPAGLSGVVAVAATMTSSAALTGDGRVVAWGDNTKGQCNVPAGLTEVAAIAGGGSHLLALRKNGTVVAWGDDSAGQCDVPTGLSGVVAIAAGTQQSVALKADGSLVNWGKASSGLGDRIIKNLDLRKVKAVASGNNHVAALKWDGSLAVWGNYGGQNVDLGVPLEMDHVLAISGSGGGLLVLREDGTVTGFGDAAEDNTPLNLNLLQDDPPPYGGPVPDMPRTPAAYAASSYVRAAEKICYDGGYAFAIKPDGTVKSWVSSQTANNGKGNVPAGLRQVKAVTTSERNVMALRDDGTVVVWGNNDDGYCSVPENLKNVSSIAACFSGSFLSLKSDGTVTAWGDNTYGQCDAPAGLGGVTAITAGTRHFLALREDGTVKAWGDNTCGQCDVPAGLEHVVRIFAQGNFSVALKEDGTVAAWGDDSVGQCDVPVGLTGVLDISLCSGNCAALKENGTVVVWGSNVYGVRNVPADLHDVVAVGSRYDNVYAVQADGTVKMWGSRNTYVDVSGLTNVLSVVPGSNIAIFRDGTMSYFSTMDNAGEVNNFLSGLNLGLNSIPIYYFNIDSVQLLSTSGQSVTSVARQGGCRVEAKAANNYTNPQTGLVIIQVRGGTDATGAGGGRVLGCVGLSAQVPVDGKVVSTDFTLPDDISGQAYVDVFVWDGWDTMVPRGASNQTLTFNVTK
jgi:alpha-tubulin suppressor-like RCC1 family protein